MTPAIHILNLCGVPMHIDGDWTKLYRVETKRLNDLVKRRLSSKRLVLHNTVELKVPLKQL